MPFSTLGLLMRLVWFMEYIAGEGRGSDEKELIS